MRGSAHSQELREYEVTGQGMRLLQPLTGYQGVLTGVPTARVQTQPSATPGLTDLESRVYETLSTLNEATAEAIAAGTKHFRPGCGSRA